MRFIFKAVLTSIVLFTTASAFAKNNLCQNHESKTVIAFANGILTTPDGARAAAKELKNMHLKANQERFKIEPDTLYNHTEGRVPDIIETFEQRVLEKDARLAKRYELFYETLTGNGPLLRQLERAIASLPGIVKAYFVRDVNKKLISAIKLFVKNPPQRTNSDLREHMAKIDTWVLEGKKILIVAHSQGNLFANAAYQHARTKVGKNNISLIHVAPPSFIQNGPYVLADKDEVIKALKDYVGSPFNPTDTIPEFKFRPPNRDGNVDDLGHGMLEIYLNHNLSTYGSIKKHMDHALQTLVAPPKKASTGFFTVTMTWDGYGDVDLHVTEPTGNHVYFMKKRGDTGYLDVDNRYADGPEHYFASCDSKILTEGVWRIAVKNYRNADGRTATVQVASSRDGVLATRSVPVGSIREAPQEVFVVTVKKDPATGELVASLQ